jgi:hypothetical protein
MLVQIQGIITQLVFDHALKIRIKAESTSSATPVSSVATTPDTASLAESASMSPSDVHGNGDETETETETQTAVSEGTVTPKGKSASSVAGESATTKVSDEAPKAGNLVGKLNNLVTTDLNNIVDGRDFLFIGESNLQNLNSPDANGK